MLKLQCDGFRGWSLWELWFDDVMRAGPVLGLGPLLEETLALSLCYVRTR